MEEEIRKMVGEEDKIDLAGVCKKIINILKKYCDLREDYYSLIAIWIIGTYYHNLFPTYPFLFFNAMRGSGKTRILRAIKNLGYKGQEVSNISESALFRLAGNGSTLCIDEFEDIGGKEKATLRQLLNAAYKKGVCVPRSEKVRFFDPETKRTTESFEVKMFEVYCPVAMANINGMENVLSDRCITLILEKSENRTITKLIEDFDTNPSILEISSAFTNFQCSKCMKMYVEMIQHWNYYISTLYTDTLSTQYTQEENIKLTDEELDLFNKIYATDIDSRHLELFFPLFILAKEISHVILDETLKTAKRIVEERKGDDILENRDITLLDFLNKMTPSLEYYSLIELTTLFKQFVTVEIDDEDKWINSRWIAGSLKRLNLILHKKRQAKGIEVMLDFIKIKEKIKMFKPKIEENEQT